MDSERSCEIDSYRPNLSCRRWGKFCVAATIQGTIGLYACPTHLGQAIVAATVREGRTSVLVVPLVHGLRPPAG